ncbi:flagellar protein FlaJ [Halarchaeum rubridurum]|uniref:Flagellar protein FlaJ n=1 Tax=Halarchaeum rubridurum TaxID=489911 RepID=A0A830FZ10_9EURY|nr:type II secretion system F family protein [Halarchaeum rubridurum]MBP1953396.1 flagellar protein FlaJ [Halarchaeum rubridurum]GGM65601.1 type II secretion protein F [Halarchaeum rubridurum]
MSLGDTGYSSSDALGDAFFPLYEWLFDDSSDFVANVETKLAEARRDETVELFLSRALGVGAIVGVLFWVLGTLLGWVLFMMVISTDTIIGLYIANDALLAFINAVKVPALIVLTGLVFGSIGFAAGFGGLVGVPYMQAGERKREINMLLPDAIAFMYALSMGGMNQLEILSAMAKADDTYGEVALEFRSIVQETEYFDTDYRSAVRNRSMETPSDELGQFLTDMLSIVNSGGDMTDFLSDKKDKHMRTAKQQQQLTLDTLELFGEMYMTLSLFPLLLIIILVIMSMMGDSKTTLLYGTVYALIPLVGVGFLVLVSTVKEDEPGDGYLRLDESDASSTSREPGLFDLGLIERFRGEGALFERIYSREGTHEAKWLLTHPHLFFKRHPLYTLGLTVPAALVILGLAVAQGTAPTSLDRMQANPIAGTFVWVYLPLYIVFIPLAAFRLWNLRSRRRVVNNLSDDLRKLSSANDTGLTLLESIKTVSETSSGKLAEEFRVIHAKVNYGTSLRDALVEFNNKYHIPRLARTVKLVSKAQEASSQISAVLTTAAQSSETQDDLERERKSRTRMQIVIIIMTYLTLLAVMAILKVKFLDVMAGLATQASGGASSSAGGGNMSFGASIDIQMMNMMFFHAVTIQGILSGFIAGYIRDADLLSGVKFAIVLPTVALLVFAFI